MKSSRIFVILSFMAIAALCMSVSVAAAGTAFLPGLTSTDDNPKGCVDCHANVGGKDRRLNTVVAGIKGHPNIAKVVKNLPKDCGMCHKEGSKVPALGVVLHKAHYGPDPAKSAFVATYQGACLNCHKLDVAAGAMTLKSGPANW